MSVAGFLCVAFLLIAVAGRTYALLPKRPYSKRAPPRAVSSTCKLAVFLGSGGHTTEALALVSTLDFSRYYPRVYIISEDDTLSAEKVQELESVKAIPATSINKSHDKSSNYELIVIPRARRVHQPLINVPPTAIRSLIFSLYLVVRRPLTMVQPFADVLLLNGPGTCFVLCIAVYLCRFFGLSTPKLIYVESFARVNNLSLSGKLLRPFVDKFVVQWPGLLRDGRRGECHGWLV